MVDEKLIGWLRSLNSKPAQLLNREEWRIKQAKLYGQAWEKGRIRQGNYFCTACKQKFDGNPAWYWEADPGYTVYFFCQTCGVEMAVVW